MAKDARKEEMKRAWKEQQRQKLLDSIPMPKQVLRGLLDYLERANAPKCDHSLKETSEFLQARGLDVEEVIPWLHEHGGYCDCEVILNVANEYGDII